MRTFEDKPATREQVPLLIGLIGPSGTGKTFSALRLATGIQRVSGGDIYLIDTESRRSLHYAPKPGEAPDPSHGKFAFKHVAFGAPFSSLDYLAAVEHCVKRGAKTVIIDSMSHEHEGPGGMLEQHAAETKRLAALWKTKESNAQMSAWSEPKQKRRRLINTILQMPINCIFCFRAKEKLKIVKGDDPISLGFMPIAGEEFVYEMLLKCLLLPGARGIPTWQSDMPGEKMMIKIPGQFAELFAKPAQLSESIGEELAKWAAGGSTGSMADAEALALSYDTCSDPATFRVLEEQRKAAWAKSSAQQKARLKAASDAASKRIAEAEAAARTEEAPESEPPRMREPGEDDYFTEAAANMAEHMR